MMSGTVGAKRDARGADREQQQTGEKDAFRPRRSAKRPAGINSAAATIVNDVKTHESSAPGYARKSFWISGNATNINVRSSELIDAPIETSATIFQGLCTFR